MPDLRDFLPPPPWEGPPVPRRLLREVRRGLCYELAWRYLKDHRDGTLVHGQVFAGKPLRWMGHAWVELEEMPDIFITALPFGMKVEAVYEPQEDRVWPRETFYQWFRARPLNRYTWEEAAKMALKTGHYGPWEEQDLLANTLRPPGAARFPLGRILTTSGVRDRVVKDATFGKFVTESLRRHMTGDWGDLDPEDKAENERALNEGNRLMSAYLYGVKKEKIWIITEADRSVTTVLFPEEY